MSINLIASGAILLGVFHLDANPTTARTYGLGEWRLSVHKNSFTGQTHCQLVNRRAFFPDVSVSGDAVAFRFGRGVDTEEAWFRVDGRKPKAWRSVYAELVAAGSLADAERLDNPSGGVVLIPVSELTNARTVFIEPAHDAGVRRFSLGSFAEIFASARGLGCSFKN